jgi:hypothetical protein
MTRRQAMLLDVPHVAMRIVQAPFLQCFSEGTESGAPGSPK